MARTSSDTRVDLPAPDGPMIATRSPGRMFRSRPRSTWTPSYSVTTRSNCTAPTTIFGRTGMSGVTTSGVISIRSATRSPDALARAIRPVYLAMSRSGFMVVRR